jgi:tyrosinase
MATYIRANAWNNGGTFANTDILWYAKGVGAMQARELNDPSSWWFFAAIHGEYLTTSGFPGWGSLPNPPPVPTTPQPSTSVSDQYWDQCQHQSWYFLPWHRGYLLALEAQVRAEVINLGGPSTWALPYWDYLGI